MIARRRKAYKVQAHHHKAEKQGQNIRPVHNGMVYTIQMVQAVLGIQSHSLPKRAHIDTV